MMKRLSIVTSVLMGLLLVWALVCSQAGGVLAPSHVLIRLSPCILAFAVFCILVRGSWFGKFMYGVICCYSLAECVLGTAQLLGFAQSRHALYHLTGNFLNPAPYACLLASAAVLCIVNLLRRGGGRLVRILTLTTLSWSSVMVVIARSRAVWLGMALALICVFVRESSFLRRVRHKWIPACVLAIVFIAGCAGAWMLKPESAKARLYTWQTDCLAIADNPLTGVGPGAEMGAFANAQADYFRSHERSMARRMAADVPQKPFNEFLRMGMACGIPGLVLAIAIYLLALVLTWRRRSPSAYVLTVLGTFAFFSFPLCQTALSLLLMLALADAVEGGEGKDNSLKRIVPLALAAVAMVPLVYLEVSKRVELKTVIESYEQNPLDSRALSGHYGTLCDDPQFLLLYGKSLYDERLYPEAEEVFARLARFTADPLVPVMQGEICRATGDPSGAEAAYLKSYYTAPSRLTPLYFLSVLYRSYGMENAARLTCEYALFLPVDEKYNATMAVRSQIEGFLLENN